MASSSRSHLPLSDDAIVISSNLSDDATTDEEDNPMWEVPLIATKASGKQALGIPAHVVKDFLQSKLATIKVDIDDVGDGHVHTHEVWELKYTNIHPNQCMIGHGWYEFCKKHKLKEGDHMTFIKHPKKMVMGAFLTREKETADYFNKKQGH